MQKLALSKALPQNPVCCQLNATDLGKKNIERGGELLLMLVERFISVFFERLRGKKMSGADTSEEEKILAELEELK